MNLLETVPNSGPVGQLEVGLCPLLSLLLIIGCVRLIKGRSLPPVLLVAALVLPMGLSLYGGWRAEQMSLEAIAMASAETKTVMHAAGIAQSIGVRMLAGIVMAILSAVTLLGCAVAATRTPPHGRGIPALAFLLSLGIGALTVVGGLMTENLMGGVLRGGFYVLMGALAAAALRSESKPSAGRAAGVVAAIALPVLVAGVEVASMSGGLGDVFTAIAYADVSTKAVIAEQGMALIATQQSLAQASVVLGMLLAAVASFRALEGSLRDAGIICALLYALLLPMWVSADPSALLESLVLRAASVE